MRQPSFDSVKEMLRHFTSTTPAPRPARPEAFTPGHPCGSTLPQPARHVQAALSRSTPGGMPLAACRSGGLPRRAGGAASAVGRGVTAGGRRSRGGSGGRVPEDASAKTRPVEFFPGSLPYAPVPPFQASAASRSREAPPQLPQRCRAHLHEAGPPDCITSWRLTGGIGSASRG